MKTSNLLFFIFSISLFFNVVSIKAEETVQPKLSKDCEINLPEDCRGDKPLSECSNLPLECMGDLALEIKLPEKGSEPEPPAELPAEPQFPDCMDDLRKLEESSIFGATECREEIPLGECSQDILEQSKNCEECLKVLPENCKDKPLKICENLPPVCAQKLPPNGEKLPPKRDDCTNSNAGIFYPEKFEPKDKDDKTTMDIPRDDGGSSGFEINSDGQSIFGIKPPNNSNESKFKAPPCAQIEIKDDGSFNQYFDASNGSQSELNASANGDFKFKLKLKNGKELNLKAPPGSNVEMRDDGSVEQDYSTKDSKVELKMGINNGDSELNLESEDGKIEMKSELAGKIDIKELGGFKQSFETENSKISIEGSKQANLQAVLNLANLNLKLTPPKDGNISVKKDGSVVMANDTITSIGNVISEISVNSEIAEVSVEINIQNNQRGVSPEKLFYSTRKNISNVRLEVILDEENSQKRDLSSTESKVGKIKALFSTRGSFNFKENNLREIDNSLIEITPIVDTEFEENLYFDNSKELKLKSGSANIKGFFSTSKREFNMKSNSAIISENSLLITLSENNLQTTLNANSNGDLNVSITNFETTKRGLKVLAKKLFYSVRKDFINVKLEVMENSTQREFKTPKIKTLFSIRGSFNFKSSNLRTIDDTEIIPIDENTTFSENISEDGSRYIQLISGEATINGENMILDKSYELPELKLIEVEEDLNVNQEVKLALKKYWNLISSPISEDISDKFIFEDYDLIWSFKDDTWIKNPNVLYYENGYWINSNRDLNITFKGYSYIPNLKISTTWALVGTGTEINDINSLMNEEKIEEIYQFKENKWFKSKDINSIKIGDGFWIKKIPTDFVLNEE